MTTPNRPIPCTCRPVAGCHGIILHADQVADLTGLLATIEDWLLLHASGDVYDDLHHFLTGLWHGQPDGIAALIDELGTTASQLTRTSHDPQHTWTPC